MDKKQLIDIIISDLTEVTTLVKGLNQQEALNEVLLKIALSKTENVIEELQLLKQLPSTPSSITPQEPAAMQPVSTPEQSPTVKVSEEEKKVFQEEVLQEMEIVSPEASLQIEIGEKVKISSNPVPSFTQPPKEDEMVEEKQVSEVKENSEDIPTLENEEIGVQLEEPTVETPLVKIEENREVEVKDMTTIVETSESISPPNQATILAESLKSDQKASVNDRLGSRSFNTRTTSWENKPISDLRRALSLNDRFRFQRELFNGNADRFNDTLNRLNQYQRMDEALEMLKSQEVWDWENEIVVEFVGILERRFQ